MKTLAYIISWSITQLALAGICTLIYHFLLKDALSFSISFLNWVGIIIISSCIIPSGRIIKPQAPTPGESNIMKNRFESEDSEYSLFNTIMNRSKNKNGR
jgi:ABC-type transport system involved in multi-copper enzyme maturation permease subunit